MKHCCRPVKCYKERVDNSRASRRDKWGGGRSYMATG